MQTQMAMQQQAVVTESLGAKAQSDQALASSYGGYGVQGSAANIECVGLQ